MILKKLDPVITLVLNYSQKEWKKPKQLQDVLNIPDDMRKEFEKWISPHSIGIINLANQSESTMQMYHSDFKYIVRYLSCKNDKEKLESFSAQRILNLTIQKPFQIGWSLSQMTTVT